MGAAAGAAAIGAVGAIGASTIASSSRGSGGSASSSGASSSAPWQPQQQPILNGLTDAQSVYQTRNEQGPFTGEMVAGGNSGTASASTYAGLYSGGTGQNLVQGLANSAGTLGSAASPYVTNASNMATNGIAGTSNLQGTLANYASGQQSVQGANPALSGALNASAVSGANGLGGFQSTLQTAANQGLANPTSQVEANAQTYANSPQVQASLNATNTAINQTLNQQTLPTQNQQEAQAGALNSSRSGMAEGMAQQAAATSEGQADASIENNAYNTGMGTAAGLYTSGLNTATNASMYGYNDLANNANTQAQQQINLGETNASNQMNAANSGLSFATNNANTQLNANSQLGNATNMGLSAANSSLAGATSNYNLASAGGLLQQSMQQASDTNLYDQYQNSNTYAQNILQNYMGIVGAPYGQQGATTGLQQTQVPSNPVGSAVGGATAAYGLYNQYQQAQNNNSNSNPTNAQLVAQGYQIVPAGNNYATGSTAAQANAGFY